MLECITSRIILDNANLAADILIPRFSDYYDIEMRKPNIEIRNDFSMGHTKGIFIDMKEDGVKLGLICLRYSSAIKRRSCGNVMSHELGHSATYQNRELINLWKYPGYYCLEEGLATEFQMTGLKILKYAGYIGTLDMYLEKIPDHIFTSETARRIVMDPYSIGYGMVNHLKGRGVKVKDMIVNPLEYEKEILDYITEYIRFSSLFNMVPQKD